MSGMEEEPWMASLFVGRINKTDTEFKENIGTVIQSKLKIL